MKQSDYRSPLLSPLHAAYQELARRLETRSGSAIESVEGHMLSYVARYGPCPVGRLAEVFGAKAATLTGQLDRLEQRGLLRRELNPDDRRSFLVRATPRGLRVVQRLGEHLREIESELIEQIPTRDYQAFMRVIETIRGAVPAKGNHA